MKLVLDTSVIVEYVIRRSPYREKIKTLFEKKTYDHVIYITPITISETLYVVSRIYSYAGIHNPNREALNYVTWILSRTKPVEINGEIAINAGELKKKLHISLADCYVIAAAEALGGKPVFKKPEKEMMPVLDELRKTGAVFLDELDI